MYIKIYFDTTPLFLCDAIEPAIEPFLHHDDAVFIDELNLHTVKSMIHEMQLEKVHAGVFLHHNLEELKKAFFRKFTVVPAAGGFVENENGEVLLIFRRGKWDLPKGKLDPGEDLATCALREVKEETGLKTVELVKPLLITWHTYHEGTRFVLKDSHWYHMRCKGQQKLVPQAEEDITEIKWVPSESIEDFYALSYPSVVDVLKAGFNK